MASKILSRLLLSKLNTGERNKSSNASPSPNTGNSTTPGPKHFNITPNVQKDKAVGTDGDIEGFKNPPADILAEEDSKQDNIAHNSAPVSSGEPSTAGDIPIGVSIIPRAGGEAVGQITPAANDEASAQNLVNLVGDPITQLPQPSVGPKSTKRIQYIQRLGSFQTVNDPRSEFSVREQEEAALWDKAYDYLKAQRPRLMNQYEMIISASLVREEGGFDHHTNRISQTDTTVRRTQQAKALDIWLKDAGKEIRGISPLTTSPRTQSLREIMKSLVQRPSYTSLGWLAICLGTEAIMCHDLPSVIDHSPIISVASKMQWYLALPKLIPSNEDYIEDASVVGVEDTLGSITKDTSDTADKRAITFRLGIIELYKAILHIGIYSTCSSSVDSPLLGNGADSDNPYHLYQQSQSDFDIVGLEQALAATFNSREVEAQLYRLLRATHLRNDDDDDASTTENLIRKLHVTPQPIGSDWDFFQGLSRWSIKTPDIGLTGKCDNRVLWVTGDDTSKAVFLRSVVQEFLHPKPQSASEPTTIAYLFCDGELKSQGGISTSIVRSLIWQVLHTQHVLSKHFEDKLLSTERDDFNDPNDFYALSTLLHTILQDEKLNTTYFVLHGLEELCGETLDEIRDPYRDGWGLTDIVRLIGTTSQLSERVRWLVSTKSENTRIAAERLLDIEFCPDMNALPITGVLHDLVDYENSDAILVVNKKPDTNHKIRDTHFTQGHIEVLLSTHDSIRHAADEYISSRVREMAKKAHYGGDLQWQVVNKLQALSEGNLVWVNLACDIIESKGVPWNAPRILEGLKRDLSGLYAQRQEMHQDLEREDKEFCDRILSTTSIAFYPISLAELAELIKLPAEVNLQVIIGKMCFIFLEIIGGKVRFRHSTAWEYLRKQMEDTNALSENHAEMVMRCLGAALNRSQQHTYSKLYWIRHLSAVKNSHIHSVMGPVNEFLTSNFLEWLEALASQQLLQKAQTYLQALVATWDEKPPYENKTTGTLELSTLLRNVRGAIWFLEFHHGLYGLGELSPQNTVLFCPRLDILKELLPFNEELLGLTTAPAIRLTSHVYDLPSQVLKGHLDCVVDFAYSPGGRLVASVSEDESVKLWDSKTWRVQHIIDAPNFYGYLSQVVFSPRSRGMLAATNSSRIHLWHVSTGARVSKPLDARALIKHIAFSIHGDHLIAVTMKSVIKWDLSSYEQIERRILETGNEFMASTIVCACFDRNQRLLALATSPQNEIIIWDMEEFKARQRLGRHEDDVNDISFSPDSDILASCSDDSSMKLWNIKTGQLIEKFSIPWPRSVAFSPDGLWLACGSSYTVHVWKAVSPTMDVKQYREEYILKGHRGRVTAVRFSPDSCHILASSNDGTMRIWLVGGVTPNVKSDQSQIMKDSLDVSQTPLKRHYGPVSFVAFSIDGKMVASGSYDGNILLWDADKGIFIRALSNCHTGTILFLAFSHDGGSLISTSSDNTIGIWNISSGRMVRGLKGHTDWVRYAEISPDGKFVGSASDDGTARVWNVENSLKGQGAVTEPQDADKNLNIQSDCEELSEHGDYVYSVAFSPDGRYLASGGDENRILVWDLKTFKNRRGGEGGEVQSRQQQGSRETERDDIQDPFLELRDVKLRNVRGLVFTPPDGETLFSVSRSGVICIWKKEVVGPQMVRTSQWQMVSSFDGFEVWPNRPFRSLRFLSEHPHMLLCENGALLMQDSSSWKKVSREVLAGKTQYGLVENDEGQTWITRDDEKLIYLPPQYARGEKHNFEVQGNRVAIGCESGEVLIFKFREAEGI